MMCARNLKRFGLALLALAVIGLSPAWAAEEPLNFSILSAEDQAQFGPYWAPLLEDLGKAIGRPVKPFFSGSYSALVQAMRFNQVQIGWYSAQPALEAVRRADGAVFARTADLTGSESYYSVLIVNKASGITLDKVLKCDHTLTFGMGDPQSTSGTLAPTAFLFQPRHINPQTCFKTVRSASHEANLFAVANGVLDASTNNSVGLDFALKGSPQAKHAYDALKVIWTSPALPESAMVYRKDLDPALQKKIRDFFYAYGKAPGAEGVRQRAIMAKLHYSAFNPADDTYLAPVGQIEAAVAAAKSAH
jgi:phosphonate transport system substrate-binding protein